MTPKRAFLLGAMAFAVVAAVVLSSWLVRDSGQEQPAAAHDAGDGHAHEAEAPPSAVQFYREPKPVEAFDLQTLDGTRVTDASLRGKVVVLNFWATWCPPCRAEIPDLVALQDKYRDHLVVLGISLDEAPPADVRAFAEKYHVNYPVAMATDAIYARFPGLGTLPTSLIIDRQGRVMQKHVGLLSAARTEAETRVLAGLAPEITVELVDPDKPIGLTNAAQVREIPGVDLARLPAAKRGEALQALNAEPCTCGCGLTVARCRVDDPGCSVSLPIARRIVDELAGAAR